MSATDHDRYALAYYRYTILYNQVRQLNQELARRHVVMINARNKVVHATAHPIPVTTTPSPLSATATAAIKINGVPPPARGSIDDVLEAAKIVEKSASGKEEALYPPGVPPRLKIPDDDDDFKTDNEMDDPTECPPAPKRKKRYSPTIPACGHPIADGRLCRNHRMRGQRRCHWHSRGVMRTHISKKEMDKMMRRMFK